MQFIFVLSPVRPHLKIYQLQFLKLLHLLHPLHIPIHALGIHLAALSHIGCQSHLIVAVSLDLRHHVPNFTIENGVQFVKH